MSGPRQHLGAINTPTQQASARSRVIKRVQGTGTAPRKRGPSPLGLQYCASMTVPLAEPRALSISRTTSAGRQRRLARGVDRWHQAMTYDRVCRRRVWLVLFTTESADPTVVQGAMRRFWDAVHQRWGIQARFSWLEVQARGAAHYHAMWVDPPMPDTAATKRWLERTWGLGFVKIRQRTRRWFDELGPQYVKAETKKWGRQQYQHDYSAIPRSIRTFECQRLEFAGQHLDEHRDRQLVDYVPEGAVPGSVVGSELGNFHVGLAAADELLARNPDSTEGGVMLATAIRGDELADDRPSLGGWGAGDSAAHLVYWADSKHVERCRHACELWRYRRNLAQTQKRPSIPKPRGTSKGVTRVRNTRGSHAGGRPPVCAV